MVRQFIVIFLCSISFLATSALELNCPAPSPQTNSSRSGEGVFVDYSGSYAAYQCYVIDEDKKTCSIDVEVSEEITNFVIPSYVYRYNYDNTVTRFTVVHVCAVYNENIETITFPPTVTRIGKSFSTFPSIAGMWYSKRLATVNLPEGLEYIGEYFFSHCPSLKSIKIPSTVKTIDSNAFYDCTALESFTLPEGYTGIDSKTFLTGCTSLKELNLPSTLKVFPGAENTAIEHIDLPFGLEIIRSGAFRGCKFLTEIIIPETVEEIQYEAFKDSGLKKITFTNPINSKLTTVGNEAFINTKLSSITIPCNVEDLNYKQFSKGLTDVSYMATDLKYCSRYFSGSGRFSAFPSSVKNITFSNNVLSLPEGVFFNCDVEKVEFGPNIKSIGDYAFESCRNLREVKFNDKLETIGKDAFSYTDISHIRIPDNVVSIGANAFEGSHPEIIELGKNVKNIGSRAFNNSNTLASRIISYNQNPPTFDDDLYGLESRDFGFPYFYASEETTLMVPEESISLYKQAPVWKTFAKIIGISSSVGNTELRTVRLTIRDNHVSIINKGPDISVECFSTTGALIYSGLSQEFNLPTRGIYIVKVGEETKKIIY